MSTPAEIRAQLAEILGKVAAVPSESVRDTAVLKDLGVDSVATVELAEGVSRTFDLRLSDETVNEWRTVGDLVRTVQREEARRADRPEPAAPLSMTDEERAGAFKQLAIFFALIGAGLGVVVGIGAAVLLASSGLDAGSLPPVSTPAIPTPVGTSSESSAPSDRFTPPPFRGEDSPTPSPSADDRATSARLTASPTNVAPGERFELSGEIPGLDGGESLQIEMSDNGSAWENFPVTASAQPDGTFRTQIYISTGGEYRFRVRSESTDTTTPDVTVTIGN